MIYKKRVVIVNDNDLSNDINSAQEAADSAILEQQRIYYRSKEGRIPYGAADPTDIWITNHDDRYNELSNENAATAWSTKITPIARGIDSNENEDKYLYLYTCVQKRIVSKDAVNYTLSSDTTVNASKLYYERSGMTDNYVYTVISNPSGNPHENQYYEQSPKVPHTEILLDETTTVIDGGKIITGSVMANRLNAASINAWHQLSIGAFDANTTKAISNSTYITFIDTQRGIHVHNVDDENNYVQINATDIQLVRANVPRMILGEQKLELYNSNGSLLAEYGPTTKFYESDGTLAAQLDTEGLILKKGGIKGGTAGQNGFVYLSTENYPKNPGLSINGHTPGTNDPAWRQVIGTKFGVDSEGNLYASNAAISGEITATSLIISSGSDSYDGAVAINVSGYSIEIVSDSNGVTDTANTTYLYPYLYHNGIEVEYTLSTDTTVNSSKTYYTRSGSMGNYTYTVVSNPSGNPSIQQYYESINYSNFVWYQDDNTTGTPGDVNHNGRYLATYGHIYRVIYAFEDGGVGEAVETRIIDSSKYITRINDTGITIHPEITSGNDFLRITSEKIDIVKGNAIVASYGTGITLASNEATVTIGSTSKYHTVLTNSGMYFKNGANTTDSNLLTITDDGIKICKDSTHYAYISSDSMKIYAGDKNNAVASFGLTINIGLEKNGYARTLINTGGMQVIQRNSSGTDVTLANIGYGSGNTESGGTAIAPYYTLGVRAANSTIGNYSVAEGEWNIASGAYSHAEGYSNEATAKFAHAEGYDNKATGWNAHAEGATTHATGLSSHAEGGSTTASGGEAHAENYGTEASGDYSHAGGYYSVASATGAFAHGAYATASGNYQTAIGKFNVADTTSLFIVGKGTSTSARSNAFAIDSNGTVYVNGTSVHSSDRRLKTHITYLGDEVVDFINGLKPAHYIKDDEKHVGFYAQDVEEVDKWDCMVGRKMNGYMTLSYMDLIAPLVTYVQKLEKRIAELEGEK